MTQEEKESLLRDLCTRLVYGVMCKTTNSDKPQRLKGIIKHHKLWWFEFDGFRGLECKPYLRSMDSMTEEERELYKSFAVAFGDSRDIMLPNYAAMDWLNAHHFDYRGLIKKGLALEAPEDMYKVV